MAAILQTTERFHPDVLLRSNPFKGDSKKIVAIGASTGGVDAIAQLFEKLPENLPPIVVTQHIPEGFSTSFAHRLDRLAKFPVTEVNSRMPLAQGQAYLAPGGRHLMIERVGLEYYGSPLDGERISRHRPSVDFMFRALNNSAGRATLAIILTGMGDDGSIGIKELYDNGAYTIAQDEASCVVFGMPKQAIARGAVCEVVPLENIAQKIVDFSFGKLKRIGLKQGL